MELIRQQSGQPAKAAPGQATAWSGKNGGLAQGGKPNLQLQPAVKNPYLPAGDKYMYSDKGQQGGQRDPGAAGPGPGTTSYHQHHATSQTQFNFTTQINVMNYTTGSQSDPSDTGREPKPQEHQQMHMQHRQHSQSQPLSQRPPEQVPEQGTPNDDGTQTQYRVFPLRHPSDVPPAPKSNAMSNEHASPIPVPGQHFADF